MRPSAYPARIALFAALLTLSACQTMRMPRLDLIKSPEFSEDAANIPSSYPKTVDAPLRPEDVRSDRQWDKDAKALQSLREGSRRDDLQAPLSEAETNQEFEELKNKVQAYKQDDPAVALDEEHPPSDLKRRRN